MEMPHLGQNCSEKSCNKLDFLPVRCDACISIFCIEHYHYEKHGCESGLRKDVQVPVCPLCGEPVPTAKDVSPDLTVGRHMDQFCQSEKTKIFTNKCSFRGCKKKELIPVLCTQCKRNYCLGHRHFTDHKCDPSAADRDIRASAALSRINTSQPKQNFSIFNRNTESRTNHVQSVQGTMTEDEALAHALALSMQEQQAPSSSSNPNNNNNRPTVPCAGGATTKDKCSLS